MIAITKIINDEDLIQFSSVKSGQPMAIKAMDLKQYFQNKLVEIPEVSPIPVILDSKVKRIKK